MNPHTRIPRRRRRADVHLILGTYTVKGGPVRLDGRLLSLCETVEFDRRVYRWSAVAPGAVTFGWGDNFPRPQQESPADPPTAAFESGSGVKIWTPDTRIMIPLL